MLCCFQFLGTYIREYILDMHAPAPLAGRIYNRSMHDIEDIYDSWHMQPACRAARQYVNTDTYMNLDHDWLSIRPRAATSERSATARERIDVVTSL